MSTITVLIPRTLMSVTGEQRVIELAVSEGDTVGDLLDALAESYPIFGRRIRDETGAQRRYVNIYLDGEDVRRINGLQSAVGESKELQIIQSVAGG